MTKKSKGASAMSSQLERFFVESEKAACRTGEELIFAFHEAMRQTGQYCYASRVGFRLTDDLKEMHRTIIAFSLKKLGSRVGHEDEISHLLWDVAAKHALDPSKGAANRSEEFQSSLKSALTISRRYLAPNSLVVFNVPITKFCVGTVSLVIGEQAAKDLNNEGKYGEFIVEPGEGRYDFKEDSTLYHRVAQSNWLVRTNAAEQFVPEEAEWLIGVALSLLRITAGRTMGPFGPALGKVEPNPFRSSLYPIGTIINDDSAKIGLSRPPVYTINSETLAICGSEAFLEVSTAIFEPKAKRLSERLGQGLGWLARGRQAEDRAERFLFFFTAIEALLSGNDNTEPVVQTITRHSASILYDDPKDRFDCANVIKALYGIRSNLVHRGERKVFQSDTYITQKVAESLFFHVLAKGDLDQTIDEFQEELKASSYGLPWKQNVAARFALPIV